MMRLRDFAAWASVPLALAAVTWVGRGTGANSASIGFVLLVVVLGLAAWGGWAVGATAALAATLAFNFFFLPPYHTFTVADPENWVALACFLAAATLASRLVATARRRAEEAQDRRREVETLYDLCVGLFAASRGAGTLHEVAARVVAGIGARSGRLWLAGAGGRPVLAGAVGEGGAQDEPPVEGWDCAEPVERSDPDGGRRILLPLRVGGRFYGALTADGATAPRAVLDPAGRLLALAIERERLLAESAHLTAVRESEALKTSLLRAVSHDLATPLTALGLEIESLERTLADHPQAGPSLRTLAVEQTRLARRIGNLLAAARLEAGLARPHPEPTPVGSLLRGARESLAPLLAGREVAARVTPDCPEAEVDPSLALEALVNLVENAARAAPPGAALELAAGRDPHEPGHVRLEVLDRGPGVPDAIRRLLGAAGPPTSAGGDRAGGGLGLAIAKSFAEACGGTLELLDRPGGGTVARLTLPASSQPTAAEAGA